MLAQEQWRCENSLPSWCPPRSTGCTASIPPHRSLYLGGIFEVNGEEMSSMTTKSKLAEGDPPGRENRDLQDEKSLMAHHVLGPGSPPQTRPGGGGRFGGYEGQS